MRDETDDRLADDKPACEKTSGARHLGLVLAGALFGAFVGSLLFDSLILTLMTMIFFSVLAEAAAGSGRS